MENYADHYGKINMANHHKTILELFTIAAFNLDSVQQAVVS